MIDHLEPKFQIQNKYTPELQMLEKGRYKYDRVEWMQDYRGWKPKSKKNSLSKEAKQALIRCKARNLIVPLHQGKGYYKYDLTPLDEQVLAVHQGRTPQSQKSQFSI